MKELLEAGVHFGHQTKRWNPKMKKFIFGKRNGIYIIDLQKTLKQFKDAAKFVTELAASGKNLLFVGTKRQAQDAIYEEANRCGMFYVNTRWLGGTLTNFSTIRKSIHRLKEIEGVLAQEDNENLTKKERLRLEREKEKLQKNLTGIKEMDELPDALFVIDPKQEYIAVKEANILGIPVVAVVDTNCDPDVIDHVIPGNDDAIRAIRLFASRIADSVLEGLHAHEERRPTKLPPWKIARELGALPDRRRRGRVVKPSFQLSAISLRNQLTADSSEVPMEIRRNYSRSARRNRRGDDGLQAGARGGFRRLRGSQKILRKKGLAATARKADRAASEGLVVARVTPKAAVLLEVNCETDFVARTSDFRDFTEALADRVAAHDAFGETRSGDSAALESLPANDHTTETVADGVSHLVANSRKGRDRRFARLVRGRGEVRELRSTATGGSGFWSESAGETSSRKTLRCTVAASGPPLRVRAR